MAPHTILLRRAPAARNSAPREVDAARVASPISDSFFREMVSSMRNGVIAITSDGAVAVMNAEACRILGIAPDADAIGLPYAEVLRPHPDMVRVLTAAFELSHLPN